MCVCDKIPEDPECNIICKQLPGYQTFDRHIYAHEKGGGAGRVGQ